MRTRLILLPLLAVLGLALPTGAGAESARVSCADLYLVNSAVQEKLNEQAKGTHIELEIRSCAAGRAHYHFAVDNRHTEGSFELTLNPLQVADAKAHCDAGYVRRSGSGGRLMCGLPTGAIGTTLQVDGGSLAVTPTISDPVSSSNEYEKPQAGSRYLAVQFVLTDIGAAQIESDINVDARVVGTNRQVYSSTFAELASCTNFASGDFALLPGASETGCAVYELPEGVDVQTVQVGLQLDVEATWSA